MTKRSKPALSPRQKNDLSGTIPICNTAEAKIVTVFHNTQELSSKIDDILTNTEMKCANIIAVSETWENQNEVITLPGFVAKVKSRAVGGRGGIYARDSVIGSYERITANGTRVGICRSHICRTKCFSMCCVQAKECVRGII